VASAVRYLVQLGVCPSEEAGVTEPSEPPLIAGFRHWLEVHRGAAPPTIKQYCRGAGELLDALGADPNRWDARQVRALFVGLADHGGAATVEKRVTAVRAFLRYLIARGQCPADLDQAVPVQAHWRLASLPRCLTSEQLERLVAACEGDSCNRRRDRAIILLLARLGLRAGDVVRMHLAVRHDEIRRERVAGFFLYLHSDPGIGQIQLQRRQERIAARQSGDEEPVGVDDAVVIHILLALIRHPGSGPADVVRTLRGHSPPIALDQVVEIFARYDLEDVGKKRGSTNC